MEDANLAIIASIARDIERRLLDEHAASKRKISQAPLLRALLQSMRRACPQDSEIRPEILEFVFAFTAELESEVIPISPAVEALRCDELLQLTARLRAVLEAHRIKQCPHAVNHRP